LCNANDFPGSPNASKVLRQLAQWAGKHSCTFEFSFTFRLKRAFAMAAFSAFFSGPRRAKSIDRNVTTNEARAGVPKCILNSMAFVLVPTPDERWAATRAVRRLGYLAHGSEDLHGVITTLSSMGPDHPLVRSGQVVLFLAADLGELDPGQIQSIRMHCPGLKIVIASDEARAEKIGVDAVIPRSFMGFQLRAALKVLDPSLRDQHHPSSPHRGIRRGDGARSFGG
jgi:hypothetical protein